MTQTSPSARSYRQRLMALLSAQQALLIQDFGGIADDLRIHLLAASNTDGTIPLERWPKLEREAAALLLAYLIGNNPALPFRTGVDGRLTALAPFAQRYADAVRAATVLSVEQQAAILRRGLPSDVIRRLQRAQENPWAVIDLLFPEAQPLYRDFTRQDAVLRGDNRSLADRMLGVALESTRKLAHVLRTQLASGQTATESADALQRYLTTGLGVNNLSGGGKGIFDALRLILSETVFAFNRAGVMGAALNPQVVEVEIFTSPQHKEVDTCDDIVGGNPYRLDEAPIPPFHAFCGCGLRYVVRRQTKASVERLRNSAMINVKGPLSSDYVDLLLRGGKA